MNNERTTRLLLSILANVQVRLWASHQCDGKLLLVIKSQEQDREHTQSQTEKNIMIIKYEKQPETETNR